jgi:hypothetical protein
VLVAALATGFEAVSLQGADNLFVPFAVVVILGKITTKPLPEVVFQNLSLVAICLLVAVLVWRIPFFNVGATIGLILYAYANWSLGSWQWSLPVFCGLLCYLLAWTRVSAPRPGRQVRVRAVARAVLPPLAILVLANSSGQYATYFAPYLAASAAVVAFALCHPALRTAAAGAGVMGLRTMSAAVVGCTVITLPLCLVEPAPPLASVLAILAVVVVVAVANRLVELRFPATAGEQWTAARFVLTALAAALILVLQVKGVAPQWPPGG